MLSELFDSYIAPFNSKGVKLCFLEIKESENYEQHI
jgi:hypothetical protein